MAKRICSIEGCERVVVARSLCDPHYRRRKNAGEPLPPVKDRRPKCCSVDGCDGRAVSRGLCGTHAWRRDHNGDPAVARRYGGSRTVTAAGYIEVRNPTHPLASRKGTVLEHRVVAWDAGLFDDPSLCVHHRDGNKQNNLVENLEVMPGGDHARLHAAKAGFVTNQYGTWPLRCGKGG